MTDRDDHLEERRAQHRARFQVDYGLRCPECGEGDPLTFTGAERELRCYRCRAMKAGRSTAEQHHLLGRKRAPELTLAVDANDHRYLSELQRAHPRRDGELGPLAFAADGLRSAIDLLHAVIHRLAGWVPEFLDTLERNLIGVLGPRYWEQLGIDWDPTRPWLVIP